MADRQSKDYLAGAPVFESYLKMSLPVVAGLLISLIYNIVDIYFISLTGETELIAGVSLCSPVFTLLIALGDIFGLGGSSAVSRLLGGQDRTHARQVSALSAWAGLICGLVIGIQAFLPFSVVIYGHAFPPAFPLADALRPCRSRMEIFPFTSMIYELLIIRSMIASAIGLSCSGSGLIRSYQPSGSYCVQKIVDPCLVRCSMISKENSGKNWV